MSDSFLVLDAGDVQVALEAAQVEEIADPPAGRPLPRAPRHLVGLASVRGRPLPLVDLACLVQLPEASSPPARLVVLRHGEARTGLLVSRVRGVVASERRPVTACVGSALRALAAGEIDTPAGIAIELDAGLLVEAARAL